MNQTVPPPANHPGHKPHRTDGDPPTRSKITGGLAALACAACCLIPLLIATGVVTAAGAAVLKNALLAVSAALTVAALGMWWLHRRRGTRAAAGTGTAGNCAGSGCGC